jgi:pre-rRNA-processing protein TSR1
MSSPQVSTQHHHRSTTKTLHKPFKTRHATKSALKDRFKGKVEKGLRQTKHQVVMSKLDRRNQAKQRRLTVQANHTKVASIFAGRDGAPRIIAVVPLYQNVDNAQTIKSILKAGDVEDIENIDSEGIVQRHVDRFKQNVAFLPVKRNLWDVLDACRMADYVLFVMHATEEIDPLGEMLLKSSETQGISNVLACVQVGLIFTLYSRSTKSNRAFNQLNNQRNVFKL